MTIRIGWQKGGVVALLKGSGVLERKLESRGIGVSWSEFTSGPPLLEALGAGALDFGTTGDVPPLFAHAARGNLVFVGASTGAVESSAILIREGSPIGTLSDLKGRRVAYKRGSSAHNFVVKALRTADLTLADITSLDLSPPDAAAAFASGAVDAWAIWDPYFAAAQDDPATRVLVTTEGIVDVYNFYSANGAFARENGALVVELIETLRTIGRAAQNDIDGTIASFARATGLGEPVLRRTVSRKGYDLGAIGFMEERHVAYEQALADEFHALGVIPRKLDIAGAVWRPETA